jgi:hypothetical protein
VWFSKTMHQPQIVKAKSLQPSVSPLYEQQGKPLAMGPPVTRHGAARHHFPMRGGDSRAKKQRRCS